MVKEGALDNPKVDAVFGLHVTSRYAVGEIAYKPASMMAAVDSFKIKVHGKQTHGAYPWLGVDPIVIASQIVLGLQTIPSRQVDSSLAPSIVTVGAIHGGVRNNIIPDEVEMVGTIRSLDAKMREEIHARIKRTAEDIAMSGGGKADVEITTGYRSRTTIRPDRDDGADSEARFKRKCAGRERRPRRRRLLVLPAESARSLFLGRPQRPKPRPPEQAA